MKAFYLLHLILGIAISTSISEDQFLKTSSILAARSSSSLLLPTTTSYDGVPSSTYESEDEDIPEDPFEPDDEIPELENPKSNVVQNMYNVKIGQLNSSGYLWLISGILLIIFLLLGIVTLIIFIFKMNSETTQPKMIMMSNSRPARWDHDPIFEIPINYGARDSNGFKEENLQTPPDYHESP